MVWNRHVCARTHIDNTITSHTLKYLPISWKIVCFYSTFILMQLFFWCLILLFRWLLLCLWLSFSYDPLSYLVPFLYFQLVQFIFLQLILLLITLSFFNIVLNLFLEMLNWIHFLEKLLVACKFFSSQKMQNCYLSSKLLLELVYQYFFCVLRLSQYSNNYIFFNLKQEKSLVWIKRIHIPKCNLVILNFKTLPLLI